MNAEDFAKQELPLLYKTKTIKRFDDNTFVFHCTTRSDSGGRVNRNMVVIQYNNELTVIDPLKLTDEGERKLGKLGKVKRIIRLGPSLHCGHDDEYYIQKYCCLRLAPGPFLDFPDLPIDFKLSNTADAPFPECRIFSFEETIQPEAVVLLERPAHGNLLISGESLQCQMNNEFVNNPVVAKMKLSGLLESEIVISPRWIRAMAPKPDTNDGSVVKVNAPGQTRRSRLLRMSSLNGSQKRIRADFMRILGLKWTRLLSTSGNVAKNSAKEAAVLAVESAFPLWERSSRNIKAE